MKRPPLLTIEQTVEAANQVVTFGLRGAIDASVTEVHSMAVLIGQLNDLAQTAAAFLDLNDKAETDEDRELAVLAQIRLRQLLGLNGYLNSNSSTEQRGN